MSSAKSPWKDLGLSAMSVMAGPKRRKRAHDASLFSSRRIPIYGHDWRANMTTGEVRATSYTCKHCERPRFAVDGRPCRRRRG